MTMNSRRKIVRLRLTVDVEIINSPLPATPVLVDALIRRMEGAGTFPLAWDSHGRTARPPMPDGVHLGTAVVREVYNPRSTFSGRVEAPPITAARLPGHRAKDIHYDRPQRPDAPRQQRDR